MNPMLFPKETWKLESPRTRAGPMAPASGRRSSSARSAAKASAGTTVSVFRKSTNRPLEALIPALLPLANPALWSLTMKPTQGKASLTNPGTPVVRMIIHQDDFGGQLLVAARTEPRQAPRWARSLSFHQGHRDSPDGAAHDRPSVLTLASSPASSAAAFGHENLSLRAVELAGAGTSRSARRSERSGGLARSSLRRPSRPSRPGPGRLRREPPAPGRRPGVPAGQGFQGREPDLCIPRGRRRRPGKSRTRPGPPGGAVHPSGPKAGPGSHPARPDPARPVSRRRDGRPGPAFLAAAGRRPG